jgi:hypothetical protein
MLLFTRRGFGWTQRYPWTVRFAREPRAVLIEA